MASNQTEHYGLNQWVGEDPFIREEFNDDNRKIDAALAANTAIVCGTYTGECISGQQYESTRIFDLGFTPKAVFLSDGSSLGPVGQAIRGGMAIQGAPVKYQNTPCVEIIENGFQIWHHYLNYQLDMGGSVTTMRHSDEVTTFKSGTMIKMFKWTP